MAEGPQLARVCAYRRAGRMDRTGASSSSPLSPRSSVLEAGYLLEEKKRRMLIMCIILLDKHDEPHSHTPNPASTFCPTERKRENPSCIFKKKLTFLFDATLLHRRDKSCELRIRCYVFHLSDTNAKSKWNLNIHTTLFSFTFRIKHVTLAIQLLKRDNTILCHVSLSVQ